MLRQTVNPKEGNSGGESLTCANPSNTIAPHEPDFKKMYSNETKGLIPQAAAERIGNEGCPA